MEVRPTFSSGGASRKGSLRTVWGLGANLKKPFRSLFLPAHHNTRQPTFESDSENEEPVTFGRGPSNDEATRQQVVRLDALYTKAVETQAGALQHDYHSLLMLLCQVEHAGRSSDAVSRLIKGAHAILMADRVALFRLDSEKSELVCEVSQGVSGRRVSVGQGVVGHVAATASLVNLPSVVESPLFEREVELDDAEYNVQNVLCVPILGAMGEVVAVLQALNKKNGVFTVKDEYMISVIAHFAGDAIGKAIMLEEAQKASTRSHKLVRAIKSLGAAQNPRENFTSFAEKIVEVAYGIVDADRITLFIVDDIRRELLCVVSQDLEGTRLPLDHGVAGHVATTGEPTNISDVSDFPDFDPSQDQRNNYTTRSLLCLPVFDDRPKRVGISKRPIAVLEAINSKHGKFTEDDEDVLKAFCKEVGISLGSKSLDLQYEKIFAVNESHSVSYLSSFLGQRSERCLHGRSLTNITLDQGTFDPAFQTLEVDVFSMNDQGMSQAIRMFFNYFNLLEHFSISDKTFDTFVQHILELYQKKNPFHNSFHAFSVLHVSFLLLARINKDTVLSPLDIFCVLVSAICHDVDHPGLSNSFLIKARDEKAIIYNDQSVLENHHAATAFKVLLDDETNILSGMGETEQKKARQAIISCILSTDMSRHVVLVSQLEKLDKFETNSEDRELLRSAIIHVADLSGQAMPSHIAFSWGDRVIQEFRNQAALERARDIEVDAFMQNLDDSHAVAQLQINFIDFIVRPLWQAFAGLYPYAVADFLDNLENNRKLYVEASETPQ